MAARPYKEKIDAFMANVQAQFEAEFAGLPFEYFAYVGVHDDEGCENTIVLNMEDADALNFMQSMSNDIRERVYVEDNVNGNTSTTKL